MKVVQVRAFVDDDWIDSQRNNSEQVVISVLVFFLYVRSPTDDD